MNYVHTSEDTTHVSYCSFSIVSAIHWAINNIGKTDWVVRDKSGKIVAAKRFAGIPVNPEIPKLI